jgi:aromatic-L-amino-acid decarboxylase
MDERDPHMSAEDFRRAGRDAVDWIADYFGRLEHLPVRSRLHPGEVRARLPPSPPGIGEPFEAVLRDLDTIMVPGLTHWQSPSFFAYFPSNSSGPSVLGELVSAALGVQGMLWITSPACTELETHVLDWLAQMLDLPSAFHSTGRGGGVIQDSGSSSTLCALLAARERATAGASNRNGTPRGLTVYLSTQAHSSVEKAARVAGLGSASLRFIDVDERYGMIPARLEERMADDVRHGAVPCMVVATLGTTSSTAVDPLPAVGDVCRRFGAWLHVHAAMCGAAALCPELRSVHDGLELADSYCVNPHKWLLVNVDCSCLYVADRTALTATFGIAPEYLRNAPSSAAEVIDYRDWQVPLARRFRALKLWFVIRHYGVEGLRLHVRDHVRWARDLARHIASDPDFELAAPVPFSLVCFRHRGGDELNARILEHVNASGEAYLSHTRLGGRYTLRLAVGQHRTREEHVRNAWTCIRQAAVSLGR